MDGGQWRGRMGQGAKCVKGRRRPKLRAMERVRHGDERCSTGNVIDAVLRGLLDHNTVHLKQKKGI